MLMRTSGTSLGIFFSSSWNPNGSNPMASILRAFTPGEPKNIANGAATELKIWQLFKLVDEIKYNNRR